MKHYYKDASLFGSEDWFKFASLYRERVLYAPSDKTSKFVEVGAFRGRSTAFLGVEIVNSRKPIELYVVDHFEGSREHKEMQLDMSNLDAIFHRNIKPIADALPSRFFVFAGSSVEAAGEFSDRELDFVMQFPADARRDLVYGAVLRDIGMLRIDPAILRTGGQLTSEQWEIVRRHTLEGAQIMRQMRFDEIAVDVVLHHHEAYNGEGYPAGLRGRAIPLGARLVAVAESYVKMTMDRSYRKAIGPVEALESLAENWGLRYDPLIVDALVRIVNRELSTGLDGDMDLARDLFGVS